MNSMGRRRVIVAERLAKAVLESLTQQGLEIVDLSGSDRSDLLEQIEQAEVLLVRSQTKVDKELLDRAKGLKLIGRAGTGVDNIDVACALSKGMVVVNAPGANAISVAEHAFGHMLSVARRIGEGTIGLKQGLWQKKALMGIELFGKTLGLMGCGRIGKEMALRAKAFGMKVIAVDPYLSQEIMKPFGVERVDFDRLCADSDVISLHLPVSKETRNILNREAFQKMKTGVILVNCARGGLIDEEALEQALREGKVFGVGLDVFDGEPSPRASLVNHPRVVATPHIAASTPEAEERAGSMVAEEVVAWAQGKPLRFEVA